MAGYFEPDLVHELRRKTAAPTLTPPEIERDAALREAQESPMIDR
jgi:hypothetical protein